MQPAHCDKLGVIYFLTNVIKCNVNLEFLHCGSYDTTNIFLEYVTWTKNINKILKGKLQANETIDSMKKLAKKVYIKHKKISAKIKMT